MSAKAVVTHPAELMAECEGLLSLRADAELHDYVVTTYSEALASAEKQRPMSAWDALGELVIACVKQARHLHETLPHAGNPMTVRSSEEADSHAGFLAIEALELAVRAQAGAEGGKGRAGLPVDLGVRLDNANPDLAVLTYTADGRLRKEEIKLRPKEYAVLRRLVEDVGRAVPHSRIYYALHGEPVNPPYDESVSSAVSGLRTAIMTADPALDPKAVIEVVSGYGYRLNASRANCYVVEAPGVVGGEAA